MLLTKKLRPVGVCSLCHAVTYKTETINQRCGRSPNGRRCRGEFKAATREVGWKACTSCEQTGVFESRSCPFCNGVGWHLMRAGRL
jgi:RNA polymerase subunit RPABC4/transcription elongation factor Spt4